LRLYTVVSWFQAIAFNSVNLYRYTAGMELVLKHKFAARKQFDFANRVQGFHQEEWGSDVSGASEHLAVTEATSRNANANEGRRVTLGMRFESMSSLVRCHWGVLIWARTHGCDWDEDECLQQVVGCGELEVLRLMREREGVWDERICEYAVEYDVPVLHWARRISFFHPL
jgi:hypothetical protein